ncbi:hypothetical protein D5086_033802 [Populus alba]|uniref:Uncharacterized protein n=1 Tax=Populus alba TaxID=43335 RepID=A0ACC4AHU0_POPAL
MILLVLSFIRSHQNGVMQEVGQSLDSELAYCYQSVNNYGGCTAPLPPGWERRSDAASGKTSFNQLNSSFTTFCLHQGNELQIRQADLYLSEGEELSFYEVLLRARQRREIVIGYRAANAEKAVINPPAKTKGDARRLGLNVDLVKCWFSVGAQPTYTVRGILMRAGLISPPPMVVMRQKKGPAGETSNPEKSITL